MQGAPKLTLEFFHDVVCGWCFNLSPRLRAQLQTQVRSVARLPVSEIALAPAEVQA